MNPRSSESGLTLVELMVATSLSLAGLTVGAVAMRDHMATARTLSLKAEANVEMGALVKNLTRDFQTTQALSGSIRTRACILERSGLTQATDPNPKITDFQCLQNIVNNPNLKTDGIGFNIVADPTTNLLVPTTAYINTCEAYNPNDLPVGRGGQRHSPPRSPDSLQWGGASSICPMACPEKFRPVVKFIGQAGSIIAGRQVPSASQKLNLWGAVICGAQFRDSREIQQLRSRDFSAQYINVLTFVARARFDIIFPQDHDANGQPSVDKAGNKVLQSYVWLTGGTVLDFLDSQEMSIYKCSAGTPGC
jgi:hypothetical protein